MQPITEDAIGKEKRVKRYVVKQKALALGESFTIECVEKNNQHKAFQVHGTPIPLVDKLSFRDASGNELFFTGKADESARCNDDLSGGRETRGGESAENVAGFTA